MKKTIVVLAVAILLISSFPIIVFAAPPGNPTPISDFSSEQILVKFKPGTTLPEAAEIHRQAGGRLKETIPAIGVQVVTVPAGKAAETITGYAAHPEVMYAEPNYIAQVVGEPDDTYFLVQWGMQKVQAPEAWDMTTGSASVNIAILDTGVDADHPDLIDKIIDSINFSDSPTADDMHGHGTHVAGIAGASTNNAIGVAGLGYKSSIMNVKVLDDSGSGYYTWVASGIIWAADNGAQVINLSLGGKSGSQLLEDAVNYAWSKGVVVVAAAGNSGTSSPFYPAHYTNCIAVAGTDSTDSLASWSTFGDWVDVAAPGVSIYSTIENGRYGNKSGTSMASPHVAGLAALLFAAVTDVNGNGLLNDEARSRIESTCDDIGVAGIGSGRINAARAVGGDDIVPQPDVQIVKVADPTSVSEAGTLVTYSYIVTNIGDVTLTGIVVNDDKLGNIALASAILDPGAVTTGTATYTVAQADIDAGADIVNIATVTTDQGVTAQDSATVTIVPQPDVQIVKMADPTSVSEAGTVVTYSYIVTNTGDVTLTGVAVNDDKLGDIVLASATLDPGASTSGTATYTITQADIDSGADIVNVATVTTDQGVTAQDSATVTIVPQPDVQIIEMSDPTSVSEADTVVTYSYIVTNTGDVTLTGILVTDDSLGNIPLATTTLAPGASTSGKATYTVTQADLDAGADIVNIATVTTDQGVTDRDSATVTIEAPKVAMVTISPTVTSDRGWPGEYVVYEFTVENVGNVPDTYDIFVTSGWASSGAPQSITLEPAAAATVTVTHSVPEGVSPGDFDTGTLKVVSSGTGASASASFATTAKVSAVEINPGEQSATAAPGETVVYTYTISNTGTEDDVYNFVVSATWEASLSTTSVSVEAGGSTKVMVSHTIVEGAVGGNSDTGTLTVTSERVSASATFTTTAQKEEKTAAPVIHLFKVSNTSNPIWSRVAVECAVSAEAGNLATVEITMVLDGKIVDSGTFSVGGYDASGKYQLRNRDGHGKTYEITLIVTDTDGNTASKTESIYL